MRPPIRMLVLWLLIALLPVQGIAAAARLPCAMVHAAMAGRGAGAVDDCDDAVMAMPAARVRPQAHAAIGTLRQDMHCHDTAHHKLPCCGGCAGCHVSALAPPPLAMAAPAAVHPRDHYISPASSFEAWVPARIDRPPRR